MTTIRWHKSRQLLFATAELLAWMAVIGAMVMVLSRAGLDRADKAGTLLAALVAVTLLVLPRITRVMQLIFSRGRPVLVGASPDIDAVKEQLAQWITAQWQVEATIRRLGDPWPLPLRWLPAGGDVSDHLRLVFAGLDDIDDDTLRGRHLSGRVDQVVQRFRDLPNQRLVIVGPAGSGKTILALLLTLGLLKQRSPADSVPVFMSICSWNPTEQTLSHWMADYLVENYPALAAPTESGGTVAELLVSTRQLLPVLDGLDEIPGLLQVAALAGLNAALDNHSRVVLTCRAEDYRRITAAGDVLTRAAVVELQPLTVDEVKRYLTDTTAGRRAEKWQPVFAEFDRQPHGAVATALSTPLMIALARTIYSDTALSPDELLSARFRHPHDIDDHLLDALLPTLYPPHNVRGGSGGLPGPARPVEPRSTGPARWSASDAKRWLGFLAVHTQFLQTRDIAWWQIQRAVPRTIMGLLISLPVGVITAAVFSPVVGAILTLMLAVTCRARVERSATVEHWFERRIGPALRRATRHEWLGETLASLVGLADGVPVQRKAGLAFARTVSLFVGAVVGIAAARTSGLAEGLARGVSVALAVGLTLSFVSVSPHLRPRQIRLAVRETIAPVLRHLLLGTTIGVAYGVVIAAAAGNGLGLIACAVAGFGFGLLDAINIWLDVPADIARATDPATLLRADRLAAIARAVTVGSAAAITAGIAYTIMAGPRVGVLAGIGFGVGFGISVQSSGAAASAWGRFLIARTWLATFGLLPWRLLPFLDDAHRRGLLRRCGSIYQFRHARLDERLLVENLQQRYQPRTGTLASRHPPTELAEPSTLAANGNGHAAAPGPR
jgi:hypothetical protein